MKNILISTLAFVLSSSLVCSARAADTSENLAVTAGKAKVNALLQMWMLNDDTVASAKSKWNFRPRRAEVRLSGNVTEDTRWFVMLDAAKNLSTAANGDLKPLQDLGVAFSPMKDFEIIAGQFKAPSTAEGLEPSAEILFPERSAVARAYGDRRDRGLMLTYKTGILKFSAMVSNGEGPNVDDINNSKDLTLRADAGVTDELKLGAFTTAADFGYGRKGAWGANAKYTMGELLVKAEAVKAQPSDQFGFAGDLAYLVTPEFQPMVRYEKLDNGAVDAKAMWAGFNYYLLKHNSKIQTAFGKLDQFQGKNGGYDNLAGASGALMMISFQAAI